MGTDIHKPILDVEHVSKSFRVVDQDIPVLFDVSFRVSLGEFLIIFGPSGSGKSTLLHIILGLEKPTSGEVSYGDKNLYHLDEDGRSEFRKENIGMVYQQPNWIRAMNVIENVAFPLLLLGHDRELSLKRAESQLSLVGMRDWATFVPTELSSGQQQRVSLARALVTEPPIIIADEPTGNLDTKASRELVELLARFCTDGGHTILMVTHDMSHLPLANTRLSLVDGRIEKYTHDMEKVAEIVRPGVFRPKKNASQTADADQENKDIPSESDNNTATKSSSRTSFSKRKRGRE